MTLKRIARTTGETDATGKGKRFYCYLDRAGVSSGIKRQARRRERHDATQNLRRGREDRI